MAFKFEVGSRCCCFWGGTPYLVNVLDRRIEASGERLYQIHYKGYNKRYDCWKRGHQLRKTITRPIPNKPVDNATGNTDPTQSAKRRKIRKQSPIRNSTSLDDWDNSSDDNDGLDCDIPCKTLVKRKHSIKSADQSPIEARPVKEKISLKKPSKRVKRYHIQEILEYDSGRKKYKVHWKGYSKKKATWLSLQHIEKTPQYQKWKKKNERAKMQIPLLAVKRRRDVSIDEVREAKEEYEEEPLPNGLIKTDTNLPILYDLDPEIRKQILNVDPFPAGEYEDLKNSLWNKRAVFNTRTLRSGSQMSGGVGYERSIKSNSKHGRLLNGLFENEDINKTVILVILRSIKWQWLHPGSRDPLLPHSKQDACTVVIDQTPKERIILDLSADDEISPVKLGELKREVKASPPIAPNIKRSDSSDEEPYKLYLTVNEKKFYMFVKGSLSMAEFVQLMEKRYFDEYVAQPHPEIRAMASGVKLVKMVDQENYSIGLGDLSPDYLVRQVFVQSQRLSATVEIRWISS